jgi:hypothetical protein
MKTRFVLIMVVAVLAVTVLAASEPLRRTTGSSIVSDTSVTGRDVVATGSLETVTGTLSQDGYEWYLDTPDAVYELHLGNCDMLYPDGVSLKAGLSADVTGYVLDTDIAAVTVVSDGQTYEFRNSGGQPLWAGQGNRWNSTGKEIARGENRGSVPSSGYGRGRMSSSGYCW